MHIEGEMFPAVIISQLNLIRSHNNNNDKQLRGQAVFFFFGGAEYRYLYCCMCLLVYLAYIQHDQLLG